MPTQTVPQKQSPEDALRSANTRFYAAFESLDLAEMEAVWSHDDGVTCVHPGWDLLLGWDEVRERWARLFRARQTRAHRFKRRMGARGGRHRLGFLHAARHHGVCGRVRRRHGANDQYIFCAATINGF